MRVTARRASIPLVSAAMAAILLAAPVAAEDGVRRARSGDAVRPATSVLAPYVIGFEYDAANPDLPQPFASVLNPTVTFRATPGSTLWIGAFIGSNGQGLAVAPGTSNELIMRFAVPVRRLSLVFGNDLSALQGDRARLRLYRGRRLVATVSMTPNVNTVGDQEIQYEGSAVTRATFGYTRGGALISDAAEVVDDIRTDQVCAIRGTRGRDRLVGTAQANGICGLAGSDRLIGRAGDDVLVGGKGDDQLSGGAGNDLLVGGNGNDVLRTADGVSGNDTIYAGEGDDTCIIDAGDIQFGCETVSALAP